MLRFFFFSVFAFLLLWWQDKIRSCFPLFPRKSCSNQSKPFSILCLLALLVCFRFVFGYYELFVWVRVFYECYACILHYIVLFVGFGNAWIYESNEVTFLLGLSCTFMKILLFIKTRRGCFGLIKIRRVRTSTFVSCLLPYVLLYLFKRYTNDSFVLLNWKRIEGQRTKVITAKYSDYSTYCSWHLSTSGWCGSNWFTAL